ncbi:unnamed protein product [Caenorhabditis auriculariae]|uniref:F-box domain-containing protein n=1 Tax=Caenorhabditis auriculariae TaxID=2777116 RepID=A0A8S1GQ60_9PELO|nr:unnamed protein product [Caenorhabditis auriculariae]
MLNRKRHAICFNQLANAKKLETCPTLLSYTRKPSDFNKEIKDDNLTLNEKQILRNNLIEKIKATVDEKGAFFEKDKSGPCELLNLPRELLQLIVRNVLLPDFDVLSIERLSLTSSFFYILTTEELLWKSANTQKSFYKSDESAESDWPTDPTLDLRMQFLTTPHVMFNGCYISKTSYIRQGDNTFQASEYQPWHTVTYFRVMRFHSNGWLYSTTVADNPMKASETLCGKTPRTVKAVMRGRWYLNGNIITSTLHRPGDTPQKMKITTRKREQVLYHHGVKEQNYEITLKLEPCHTMRWRLHWVSNKHFIRYFNGDSEESSFETNTKRFPALKFFPYSTPRF